MGRRRLARRRSECADWGCQKVNTAQQGTGSVQDVPSLTVVRRPLLHDALAIVGDRTTSDTLTTPVVPNHRGEIDVIRQS